MTGKLVGLCGAGGDAADAVGVERDDVRRGGSGWGVEGFDVDGALKEPERALQTLGVVYAIPRNLIKAAVGDGDTCRLADGSEDLRVS
jgi:hypothetical protein